VVADLASGSVPADGVQHSRPVALVGRVPRWASFVALVVVLAVALFIGSGVLSSTHVTNAQRVSALEAQIKCPSCQDLSVAQSTTSSAVAVRNQITRMVVQGDSDTQIENALVARYGSTVLLRPPTQGLTLLVWLVPVIAGAIALGALGTLFWRRTRALQRLKDKMP
jgi:cytochrome c-type biogenesis protein CcmH